MTEQDAFPAIFTEMDLLNNGNLAQPMDACRHNQGKSLSFYQCVVDKPSIIIQS